MSELTITHGLRRGALMKRDRIALRCGDRECTWGKLCDRVSRLAGGFRDLGLKDGDRVAMLAEGGIHYFEYHYAVPWAGGAIVPMNTRLADRELTGILDDSGARFLLFDEAHRERVRQLRSSVRLPLQYIALDGAREPHEIDYEDLIAGTEPAEDAGRSGTDLLAIVYTGGTTGRPKGVTLSVANLVANTLAAIPHMEFHEDMIYLHSTPLFHTSGSGRIYSTTWPLGTGIILPRFSEVAVLDNIETHRVTHALLVPTMLSRVMNHTSFPERDLSSLTNFAYGASIMPEAVLRAALEKLPGVRFTQSYGMTELSPSAAYLLPKYHVLEGPNAGRITSIGQPIQTAEFRIADAHDQALPSGEVGEIQVRGPMVMQGYWQQPELTAQTLRGGWMHTGDAGHMDDEGFVYLVDRIKDMIISGGENVYSGEVENVLHEHPGIRECAVIGLPDPDWVERVHAVVVPHEGVTLSAEDVIAHCRALIAGYKCPRSVTFRNEPLPLSATGKVLKTSLREEAARE